MQKNVAGQKIIVFAFNQYTNAPVTGDAANITANLRLDGGVANPVDDVNPQELERGYYYFDLTQAETNADMIMIAPASTTAQTVVIGVPGALFTDTLVASLAIVDGIVDAIKLKTDTIGGAGAIAWAYTLTDSVTGGPIDGAEVWVSTDSAGANIIASGTTDAYGVVNFTLDAGTVYVWRKRAGYNFSDPDQSTVA